MPGAAVGLIAAITILWGLNWPAMKIGVEVMSPWTFRAITVVMASAGLLLFAWFSGHALRLSAAEARRLIPVALCGVTGWHLCSAFGLAHMASGRAAIVAYLMPVIASVYAAWRLGERLDGRRLTSLALGLVGMGFLLVPDLAAIARNPLGPIFMLGAATFWALGIVELKARRFSLGPVALTGWQLALGGVPILAATALLAPLPDPAAMTGAGALAILYAGLVGAAFCFAAHNRLVGLVPAGVAAIATLAIPVVGVLSSAVLLGERVGWSEITALVAVLAAVSLVVVPTSARSRR